MVTQFYKTLWGMDGSLDEKLAKIKAAGYDGYEDWVSSHSVIRRANERAGVEYIGMVNGGTPEQFKRDLGEASDCGVVKVTVHTGAAHWTEDQMAEFFEKALRITEEFPFQVNFETHRGRALYEPLHTARLLQKFPSLYLVADLSHWTVVTESMLGNFKPALDLAISRTRHIHTRVGHEEGPQVPDPRVPAWKGHLDTHLGWWDQIRAAHLARGEKVLTLDPEFGPPNYMWTDPKTGNPTADLWDVSLWMRDLLKSRWK